MAGATSLPTVADLINEALSHLGVYAPGDALAAADQTSALFTLQGIVDGYGAQLLTVFDRAVLASFSTTAGKQTYTLAAAAGAGVDWVASFLPPVFDLLTMRTGTLELPIGIDTAEQWAAIGIKSLASNIITDVWVDYGATSHNLNFFPVPNSTIPITLYLLSPLQRFTSVSNVVALPPGYQELLTFELALKCSSKFGANVPAWLPAAWQDARSNVKAANFEPIDVYCDAALVKPGIRSGGGSINFYLGR